MKVAIVTGGLGDSQCPAAFRPKYDGRRIGRVALVTGLFLTLTTLGRSGSIEAQTQTQTPTQPQTQTQQTPTVSPSDGGQVNSPDVPTANTTEQPKPEANAIPVLKTSVNVTDSISESSPANISVLSNQILETDPGVSLDDELKIIPGFSLLRRTSGVVASVTIQGVALRGLGLAGPSRALVLWDGLPVNDPFGGWINWTRISPENVGEADVTRGATTSVFGDLAMTGAVSIFSRPEEKNVIDISQEGGTQGTLLNHATYSWLGENLGFSVDARSFLTDGYYVVPEDLRGPIDTPASDRFAAGAPRIDWFSGENRFFLKADGLFEHRNIGTLVDHESTALGEFSGHYSREMKSDTFSMVGYYEHEDWSAHYSSINATRTVEKLVDQQYVPSNGGGGAAFWQHFQPHWQVTGGADVEYVTGFSHDYNPLATSLAVEGGDLLEHGLFAQADYRLGPVQFFGGIRYQFTDARNNITAPNGGITYGRGIFRVRGSLNRSFRVPTLNELYRPYRQGNIETLANPLLVPETMDGGEFGFDVKGKAQRLSVTFFRNSITNFIEQPNIAETATTITRQRQNVGDGINEGFEVSAQQHWRSWLGSVGYLYADTKLTSGPLAGLYVPEVPHHQGSAQVTYLHHGTTLSGALLAYSRVFDDQNNQFVDPGYAVLQFSGSQHLWRNLSATFNMENALDRYYVVEYTPVVNNGAPRVIRVGLRWNGFER
jgi:outer membrane receptor protein involved in Fe transport